MGIYIINYANEKFKSHQKRLTKSIKKIDKKYIVLEYGPESIDENFAVKYEDILSEEKGGGYWLWKPYLIKKTLEESNDNDYIFYCDSGAFVINKLELLVNDLNKANQDIMGFELPLIESQWTKKEAFINLGCDNDAFYNSNQILASFILIKNTEESRAFFNEYLNCCCNKENLIDKKNENLQSSDFIDHRHDQSIFSLLYKKKAYEAFRDPSQFGMYPEGYSGLKHFNYEINKLYLLDNSRKFRVMEYNNSNYPMILIHNRKTSIFVFYIKFLIKRFLIRI